jgi:hypothetical protein
VHRDVGAILEQRRFQFFDEHAVAADRRDRPVARRIALRADLNDRRRNTRCMS